MEVEAGDDHLHQRTGRGLESSTGPGGQGTAQEGWAQVDYDAGKPGGAGVGAGRGKRKEGGGVVRPYHEQPEAHTLGTVLDQQGNVFLVLIGKDRGVVQDD